jgi:hypothetical protein
MAYYTLWKKAFTKPVSGISKTKALQFALYLPALILLVYPAIDNGFPLLYSDSGTYLIAHHLNNIPIDRPVIYSVIINTLARIFSISALPWLQAIIVVLVYHSLATRHLFRNSPFWSQPLVLGLLALLTGLPHITSQLMPDLFTAFLFAGTMAFVYGYKQFGKSQFVLLVFILFIIASHTTHMLISLGFLTILFIYELFKGRKKKLVLITALWVLSLFIIPMTNFVYSGKWYYSDSSRLFFIASLQNNGALVPWLEHACPEEDAPSFLCDNLENLQYLHGNDLLWHGDYLYDSTCLKHGGWGYCWEKRNEELKGKTLNWIKVPEARSAWINGASLAFVNQVTDFGVGMISSQKEGSAPYSVLESFFSRELEKYRQSEQYNQDIYFWKRTKTQLATVITSLLIIPVLLLSWKTDNKAKEKWAMISIALALFLLLNAAICGILSSPVDRYQARVIWLVPFLAMVILFARLSEVENKFLKKLFQR